MVNDSKTLTHITEIQTDQAVDLTRLLGFKQLMQVSAVSDQSLMVSDAGRLFNKIGEIVPPPPPGPTLSRDDTL